MSNYRRWFTPGGTYFFTVVTCRRAPLFRDPTARRLLGQVMREVAEDMPFETVATVLLWDHLHCLWSLPNGDVNFPLRWQRVKSYFTIRWRESGGREASPTTAQRARGHRGVWQRRYWEHLVRDEDELETLAAYIHYNPVKHGYVKRPADWPWSSFHRFVRAGYYPANWGTGPNPVRNDLPYDV